jgi:transcriptional regulator with XRE-family HTH domain
MPDIISDQLRAAIKASGLTPYAVAASAGVTPSIVTRFLNGERGLSLESLDAIGVALGLHLAPVPPPTPRYRKSPSEPSTLQDAINELARKVYELSVRWPKASIDVMAFQLHDLGEELLKRKELRP